MMLLCAFFHSSTIFGAREGICGREMCCFWKIFSAGSLLIYNKFVHLLYVICVVVYARK